MIAIKISPGCLLHLTASGLRPSAVKCSRPPQLWVFQHSCLARSQSLYQCISPALLQSLYIHSPEFIMNYKLTFFKARYHGKAPTCARLSYMKLKLNNRASQKCMVELAPQYETDQPSGSQTTQGKYIISPLSIEIDLLNLCIWSLFIPTGKIRYDSSIKRDRWSPKTTFKLLH